MIGDVVSMRMRKYRLLLLTTSVSDSVAVALTIANVIGAVVIVTVLEHYFRTSPILLMLSL